MDFDLANGFHRYGFNWSDGKATWYIDNKLVREVNDINKVGNADCYIVLSINLPDARASIPMITSTKSQNAAFEDFIIDYVRIYDKRPTRALFEILDNYGNLNMLSDFVDWSLNWDIIVSGNFDGDSYHDLMLYSRSEGKVLFTSCDGSGNINMIQEITGWRTTWDQIISGSFGGSGLTDLLLYDSQNGEAEFFSLDGTFNSTSKFTGWRHTWKIASGDFNETTPNDLMFYDNSNGEVFFKQILSPNGFADIEEITGWRTTWSQIITGNFGGSELTDLLLYDSQNGEAEFFSLDGTFNSTSKFTGWRHTWKIIGGNFDVSNSNNELLFYDTNNNGQAYFYSVSSPSGINLYKSYSDWNPKWDIIIPGQFSGTSNDDLLFYDK